jgi:hypothetical protein
MPRILGQDVAVDFLVGQGGKPMDKQLLLAGLDQMIQKIHSVPVWPPAYAAAFGQMKKIVFFDGKVEVNGWLVDRPCCDEDDGVFYWEASEFLLNPEADVRANTFFHDCWHVVQFNRNQRRYATDPDERVAREVDAITQQIEVAKLLGCDAREIQFLVDFRASQDGIRTRLAEGVEGRMRHQPGTLRA